ncbi:MAG: carboxymuconolactone decarboxylase family protein [Ignavibacteria bacterium]
MVNLTAEIVELSLLASVISKDDFSLIEKNLKKLKSSETRPLKIYETILQCYLFCGFPVIIETLKIFRRFFPEFKIKKSIYNHGLYKKTGERNCKLIYKNNYKKLIENINYYSPDLKEWMIIEGYGKVLGRPGLSILEREFVNVAILATRFFENQLNSHLRGCLNLGATKNDLELLLKSIITTSGKKNYLKAETLLNKIV